MLVKALILSRASGGVGCNDCIVQLAYEVEYRRSQIRGLVCPATCSDE